MSDKVVIESSTIMNGELIIDHVNGVATFKDGWGRIILRVTHLPTPVPVNVGIDLVAIRNVTSYTPLTTQEQVPPLGNRHDPATCPYGHINGVCAGDAFRLDKIERKPPAESFQEWLDDDITPVPAEEVPPDA